MNSPDAAQNKAYEAAQAISEHVGRLWMEAHAEGMRNGMEASAILLDNFARNPEVLDIGLDTSLVDWLRDQVRLMALQLPDPEGT